MMQLNDLCHAGIDFINANNDDIKSLIKKVQINNPPESNLVVKKAIVKREKGAFARFKDATAVLTRDK